LPSDLNNLLNHLLNNIGRVHPIDVPVTTMMKCISKWGAGSGKLLAGHPKMEPCPPSQHNF
jgi:hypothetical protein